MVAGVGANFTVGSGFALDFKGAAYCEVKSLRRQHISPFSPRNDAPRRCKYRHHHHRQRADRNRLRADRAVTESNSAASGLNAAINNHLPLYGAIQRHRPYLLSYCQWPIGQRT